MYPNSNGIKPSFSPWKLWFLAIPYWHPSSVKHLEVHPATVRDESWCVALPVRRWCEPPRGPSRLLLCIPGYVHVMHIYIYTFIHSLYIYIHCVWEHIRPVLYKSTCITIILYIYYILYIYIQVIEASLPSPQSQRLHWNTIQLEPYSGWASLPTLHNTGSFHRADPLHAPLLLSWISLQSKVEDANAFQAAGSNVKKMQNKGAKTYGFAPQLKSVGSSQGVSPAEIMAGDESTTWY